MLMTEVLPKLVPAGEVEQICDLLLPLNEPKAAGAIRQWETGGQLFLDWAAMRQLIQGETANEEEEDMEDDQNYRLQSARNDISFVCGRLEHLRVTTAQEK